MTDNERFYSLLIPTAEAFKENETKLNAVIDFIFMQNIDGGNLDDIVAVLVVDGGVY